jgi:hypothetical protein
MCQISFGILACKWFVIRTHYFGEEVRLLTKNEDKAKGAASRRVSRSASQRKSGDPWNPTSANTAQMWGTLGQQVGELASWRVSELARQPVSAHHRG